MAIAMAFFLWFYVRQSSTYRQEIEVPLNVINLKEGYALTSNNRPTIRVLFDADGRTLLGIRFFYDVHFVWDMKMTQKKAAFVPASFPQNVILPDNANIRVVGVSTVDTVKLITEKMVPKTLKVVPDLSLGCGSGFIIVGGYQVTPDTITVRIPESLIDSFTTIKAPFFKKDNLTEDLDLTLRVEPEDHKPLQFDAFSAVIRIDVQPLGETVLENVPIRLIHVPDDVKVLVQPSTFSIRVRGGVDFLASLSRDSVVGVIDYEKESQYQFPQPRLIIQAPADLSWSQITPSRFSLVRLDDEIR